MTILSRALGFIRDLLMAMLFGSGLYADAFFVAFRIPNLLRSFVAEGALTSAFVPLFTEELKKSHAAAQESLRITCSFLLLATGTLSVLGIIFSSEITDIFAPGFALISGKRELCSNLTAIMFPYIIFVSLIALLGSALSSIGVFGAAAFAQVIMNLVLIVAASLAFLFPAPIAILIMAGSVLLGGAAQVIAQLPALARANFSILPRFALTVPLIRNLVGLMIPALFGATIYQITIFIGTILASFLQNGSVSWLFYADRLTQLPIGVFTIALGSVLLPALAQSNSNSDKSDFAKKLMDSLRFTSFIMLPTSAFIFYFAIPIVRVLFERGAFDAHSTAMTALAVKGLALGLWSISCQSLIARAFIASKDTRTPTLIGLINLLINIILALTLMGDLIPTSGSLYSVLTGAQNFLRLWLPTYALGHLGLALASSLPSLLSLVVSIYLLARRNDSISWSPFLRAGNKAIAALLLTFGVLYFFPECNSAWSLFWQSTLSVSIFIFFSFLIRSAELNEIIARAKRVS